MNRLFTTVRRLSALSALLLLLGLLLWEDPAGPFDARDYSRLDGISLDYPWWAALAEPLFAPAHMLMGAPDYRIAIVSTLLWLLVLTPLLSWVAGWRARLGAVRHAFYMGGTTVVVLGLFLLYLLFAIFIHLPGWRLVVEDPDLIVADLQTHTYGSHDGVVSPEQNLAWHRARGYDLMAVTEHNDPRGAFAIEALAAGRVEAPVVIPAVEVSTENVEYLLGLGLLPGRGVLPYRGNEADYARKFVHHVHAEHGGAVIAMAWHLPPERVGELAALGVDAFELANTGHPDVPLSVREAMLRAAREQGAVLVASTDWHGWGGFTRTWTVVRLPGAAGLDRQARAEAVVRMLREHRADAFIPVVAGYIGPPPRWRALLAPWAESVRYLAELSPLRLAALIAWGGGLWWAAGALRRRGLRPRWVFSTLLLALLGAALLWRGSELAAVLPGGDILSVDAAPRGRQVMAIGAGALVLALTGALWERRRRLSAA